MNEPKGPKIHVIVFDDVCRVALHLSRYLWFSLGFGIGNIKRDGSIDNNNVFWKKDKDGNLKHKMCYSEDKNLCLWWVPAYAEIEILGTSNRWNDLLDIVLNQIMVESGNVYPFCIADVKGENSPNSNIGYQCDKALKFVQDHLNLKSDSKREFIISSYEADRTLDGREVLPKSPETFRKIRHSVQAALETGQIAPNTGTNHQKVMHILVTGAGFELSSWGYHNSGAGVSIGLVGTENLLEDMQQPFNGKDMFINKQLLNGQGEKIILKRYVPTEQQEGSENYEKPQEGSKNGFPIPTGLAEEIEKHKKKTGSNNSQSTQPIVTNDQDNSTDNHPKNISETVKENLDAWWDYTLKWAVDKKTKKHLDFDVFKNDRLEDTLCVLESEYRMRDAFRKILLSRDWGLMRHHIISAYLNWDCWLSTNYTRFVDRAIQISERIKEREERDYANLQSFAFHQERASISEKEKEKEKSLWRIIGTSTAAERLMAGHLHDTNFDDRVKRRYFFKLHGDIAHLHSMAIAGYDKELHSPFSMKVDEIHHIYSAAKNYLAPKFKHHFNQSGDLADVKVIWHVIGHGLADKMLTSLMKDSQVKENSHLVLVNPSKETLPTIVNYAEKYFNPDNIKTVSLTAGAYITRIFARTPVLPTTMDAWEALLKDIQE